MAIRTEDERQARIRATLAALPAGSIACVCAVAVRVCRDAERADPVHGQPAWDLWEPGRCTCGPPRPAGVDIYTAASLIAAWRPDTWPRPLRPTETD